MSTPKPRAVFLNSEPEVMYGVWTDSRIEEIQHRCDLFPEPIHFDNLSEHLEVVKQAEFAFSTWGMPEFSEDQVRELMPNLRAVFYAAGSVQRFARPFLKQEIPVHSAWVANGIPVAEFALSQILLSCKGYFRNTREIREDAAKNYTRSAYSGPGIYGNTVALIGFGVIAQQLAELLQPFSVRILVVDPFVSNEKLAMVNASRVSLEEAFSEAFVVSNHLPNIPPTERMITGNHFRSMPPNASFINTGRGLQIREDEFVEAMRERTDLTALLDVTYPEPAPADSPLYTLPNVQLSTHIAGSIADERVRMADYMLKEYDRFISGRATRFGVTLDMLETMA